MKKLLTLLMAMVMLATAMLFVACGDTTKAYRDIVSIIKQQGGQINYENYQNNQFDNAKVTLYYDKDLIFTATVDATTMNLHVDKDGDSVSYVYRNEQSKGYVVVMMDDDKEIEYVDVYEMVSGGNFTLINQSHEKYQQFRDSAMENLTKCENLFASVVAQISNGKYTNLRQFLEE